MTPSTPTNLPFDKVFSWLSLRITQYRCCVSPFQMHFDLHGGELCGTSLLGYKKTDISDNKTARNGNTSISPPHLILGR